MYELWFKHATFITPKIAPQIMYVAQYLCFWSFCMPCAEYVGMLKSCDTLLASVKHVYVQICEKGLTLARCVICYCTFWHFSHGTWESLDSVGKITLVRGVHQPVPVVWCLGDVINIPRFGQMASWRRHTTYLFIYFYILSISQRVSREPAKF